MVCQRAAVTFPFFYVLSDVSPSLSIVLMRRRVGAPAPALFACSRGPPTSVALATAAALAAPTAAFAATVAALAGSAATAVLGRRVGPPTAALRARGRGPTAGIALTSAAALATTALAAPAAAAAATFAPAAVSAAAIAATLAAAATAAATATLSVHNHHDAKQNDDNDWKKEHDHVACVGVARAISSRRWSKNRVRAPLVFNSSSGAASQSAN